MTKQYYAVFDTNVLVSALMSSRQDSPTVALLDYVLDGRIVLLYNDDIIAKDGSYMVTGNKRHFPKAPIVVSPAEMLKIVQGDN